MGKCNLQPGDNLPRLNQEEIKNLNRPIISRDRIDSSIPLNIEKLGTRQLH